mgnify:CR=1 FL=1
MKFSYLIIILKIYLHYFKFYVIHRNKVYKVYYIISLNQFYY